MSAVPRVRRGSVTTLPSEWGTFTLVGYIDTVVGVEHVAVLNQATAAECGVVPGEPVLFSELSGGEEPPARPAHADVHARVRVHSECLTGDILGSRRCDCGPQLHLALASVAREGGLVVYVRGHEGRGVGLLNKLAAYRLQDLGSDTVDAQTQLGLPVDAREYGAAAAIVRDLGIGEVTLLTNNPAKIEALTQLGIHVRGTVTVQGEPVPENVHYLRTKRERMGHHLPTNLTAEQ